MEKRNKIWACVVMVTLLLISLLYYKTNISYIYLIVYIWFGVAYGMMLQYGRFCFASASRDLFAAGVPRMAVGIIIALIFFSITQAILSATKLSTFHPAPMGIHMVIGGFIFGIGMVIAGGCASGSLYKCGEGNGVSMLVIVGICFGQAIVVDIGSIFDRLVPKSWAQAAAARNLPVDISGWFDQYLVGYVWNNLTITLAKIKLISDIFPGAMKYFVGNALINTIIPALILLVVIYIFVSRKTFIKKRKKEKTRIGLKDELAGIWSMITASKRTSLMGLLIGIIAGIHILTIKGMQLKFGVNNFGQLLVRMGHTNDASVIGKVFDPGYWYITTQEAQIGAWFLEKIGWNMHDNVFFGIINGIPQPWRNPALWMSIGIVLGALIMALLNKEFGFKRPKGMFWLWGILGGFLMGLGSRIALGCNIGGFFIRVAGGDPNGWLFFIGMIISAFIVVKIISWWIERKMAKEMADLEL
jgi:hypothetical protein